MLDRHAVHELRRAGVTARAIAKRFGVSVRTVRRIGRELPVTEEAEVAARLIGDKAYDSDRLDQRLWVERGIELIAAHRHARRRRTQDGRPLRRVRRRWKVERLHAWLQTTGGW